VSEALQPTAAKKFKLRQSATLLLLALRRISGRGVAVVGTSTWTNFPAAAPAVRLKISASASSLDPSTPIEVKTILNFGIDDVFQAKVRRLWGGGAMSVR
jgi:hypothetical protein